MLYGLLLGIYFTGVAVTFFVTAFLVGLGGKNKELWKPFALPWVWPLVLLAEVYRAVCDFIGGNKY